MAGLVHQQRKALEAQGEYVTRAKVGWFALFPKTLKRREEAGRSRGRQDINLVIYRSASGDPRNHHVIPMSLARELLTESTLSDSTAGERRWNLSLSADGERLKVTHGDRDLEVARFRGAPLVTESALGFDPAEPVTDPALLADRVSKLRAAVARPQPLGTMSPKRRARNKGQLGFARRPDVKAWVLRQADGRCELCGEPAPFASEGGVPYLEHHHVVQLANGGSDTVENSVAVCPNCHRRLHLGSDRSAQGEELYKRVPRLVPEHPDSDPMLFQESQ